MYPIQHSKTKHNELRYHFIGDHIRKGDISMELLGTFDQVADIFTKPLIDERFCTFRRQLSIENYNIMIMSLMNFLFFF